MRPAQSFEFARLACSASPQLETRRGSGPPQKRAQDLHCVLGCPERPHAACGCSAWPDCAGHARPLFQLVHAARRHVRGCCALVTTPHVTLNPSCGRADVSYNVPSGALLPSSAAPGMMAIGRGNGDSRQARMWKRTQRRKAKQVQGCAPMQALPTSALGLLRLCPTSQASGFSSHKDGAMHPALYVVLCIAGWCRCPASVSKQGFCQQGSQMILLSRS